MTFFSQKLGADKCICISSDIYNDSMYVRLGGIRNTKTWSKSNLDLKPRYPRAYTMLL